MPQFIQHTLNVFLGFSIISFVFIILTSMVVLNVNLFIYLTPVLIIKDALKVLVYCTECFTAEILSPAHGHSFSSSLIYL